MPTLVNTTPDSYNIDYYFAHYSDRHGVGFIESDPSKFCILSACFDTQEYDPSKNRHYMCVPQQPQTTIVYVITTTQLLLSKDSNTLKFLDLLLLQNLLYYNQS